MSEMVSHSNAIVNGMVDQIMHSFQTQLSTKQLIKKMPEKMQQDIKQATSQIIFTNNLPKPNFRKQLPMTEDTMPIYKRKQSKLIGNVRVVHKSDQQFLQTSSALNKYTRSTPASRYSSASDLPNKRHIRINMEDIKSNKVIELQNRSQPSTAKSFRSVIQLQSHITQLRKAYLRNLRQLQKTSNQQPLLVKPKKIPKQFTFDYDCQVIESHSDIRNAIVKSPLKSKSVSISKITKSVRSPELIVDDQNSLEEQLARNPTGSPQKEKRVYNNSSRRQISHFPYISLAQKSKLYENQNILYGPQIKIQSSTCYDWRQKSNFVPYFQKKAQDVSQQLITQNEQVVFPTAVGKQSMRSTHHGSILKNPRYFKKGLNNQSKQSSKQFSVQYNPVNVTRNHAIDQYYKIRAVDA